VKKLLDNRGRLFGVISVIDVIVILLILLLTAGVYLRFFVMEKTAVATESDPITYELLIAGVRDYTVNGFREGDIVYDTVQNVNIGTISAIRVEPNTSNTTLLDGTYVTRTVPDRYNVFLTIDTTGLISGNRYYVNRTYGIGVNTTRSMYTKYVAFSATVTSVG